MIIIIIIDNPRNKVLLVQIKLSINAIECVNDSPVIINSSNLKDRTKDRNIR
jgi:hypothetical protein